MPTRPATAKKSGRDCRAPTAHRWVGVPFPGVTHTYGVLTPGYSRPTATRSPPLPRGLRCSIQAAKRRCNDSPTSSEATSDGVGYVGGDNYGPRRGPLIPSPRARTSRIVRPLRGRGRDESNPPHTVARTSLDVGLQLHRRLAAQIPPRGRPLHRVYVVPTRPALRGARERSPEACLGVNRPTPPIRPPNGGRGLPAPPPRNSGTMRGAKLSYNPITL